MAEIGKEKEAECKQVFDLFDFDKDGFIACEKVESIVQGLGAYVPKDDLMEFISECKDSKVDYAGFMKFFVTYYTKKVDKKELIDAFEFMDKGKTGMFDAEELKHALMVLGDKLNEKEVDDLIGKYISGGKIDYKNFANELAK